jgi:hypothetical protein
MIEKMKNVALLFTQTKLLVAKNIDISENFSSSSFADFLY